MGHELTAKDHRGLVPRTPVERFLSLWTRESASSNSQRDHVLSQISNFVEVHNLDLSGPVMAAVYDFVTGTNPEVVSRVNRKIEAGERIKAGWLVNATSPSQRETGQKSLEQLLDRLEDNLDSFSSATKKARKATSDYNSMLNDKEEALSSQIDGEVSEIVTIVREMVGHARVMEDQMRRSEDRAKSLRQDLSKARKISHQDHLTRLPNRRAFEKHLDSAAAKTNEDRPLCVAFCDIDHFKKFNDEYGHDTGDRVLRNVAETLVSATQRKCFVARHGGEEFAILFENTTLRNAEILLNAARLEMASKKLIDSKTGQPISSITFSAGVARCLPGKPIGQALKSADDALYAAKRQGRNQVVANEV